MATASRLEAGENELVFAVTKAFGGWGLAARFADPSGLSWQAPSAE